MQIRNPPAGAAEFEHRSCERAASALVLVNRDPLPPGLRAGAFLLSVFIAGIIGVIPDFHPSVPDQIVGRTWRAIPEASPCRSRNGCRLWSWPVTSVT